MIDQAFLYLEFSRNYCTLGSGGYNGYRPKRGDGPGGFKSWESEVASRAQILQTRTPTQLANLSQNPNLNNGAAMRAAVLGFLRPASSMAAGPDTNAENDFVRIADLIKRNAFAQAEVTHNGAPAPREGAAVIGMATALALETLLKQTAAAGSTSRSADDFVPWFFDRLDASIEGFVGHNGVKKRTFAKQLSRARSFCIEVRDLGVAVMASDEENRDAYQQAQAQLAALLKKHKLKSNLTAVDAVSTAVAAAVAFIECTLRSSSSGCVEGGLRGLLVFAISLPGDPDTVAAMAAAVYCTCFGYERCVGSGQEGGGGGGGRSGATGPFRLANLCRSIQSFDVVIALAPALAKINNIRYGDHHNMK